jgi:hypothetical protein
MTRHTAALARDTPIWTPGLVRARLEEACETLKRLPTPQHAKPQGYRSWWPQVVYGYWEMWNGLSEAERSERERDRNRTRLHATSAQVQAMDEALTWLWHVDPPGNRRILMARCSGYSLRRIAAMHGGSHEHIRCLVDRSLSQIAQALDRERKLR